MVAAAAPVTSAVVAKVGTEAVPQVLRGDRALQDQGEVGKEDQRLHAAAAQHGPGGPGAGLAPGVRAPLHAFALLSWRQAYGWLSAPALSVLFFSFFFLSLVGRGQEWWAPFLSAPPSLGWGGEARDPAPLVYRVT